MFPNSGKAESIKKAIETSKFLKMGNRISTLNMGTSDKCVEQSILSPTQIDDKKEGFDICGIYKDGYIPDEKEEHSLIISTNNNKITFHTSRDSYSALLPYDQYMYNRNKTSIGGTWKSSPIHYQLQQSGGESGIYFSEWCTIHLSKSSF